MSPPRRLLPGDETAPLYGSARSREVEQHSLAGAPPHALIERAGAAVARLALAMTPHAQHVWVAAGPGNNGGDGLVAARWLKAAGKQVHVTWLGHSARLPADAAHAQREALLAGLSLHPPGRAPETRPDLAIDALLGLGQARAPEGPVRDQIGQLNEARRQGCRLLAIDLPTGLCADTGRLLGDRVVHVDATLALLTAKPGLFTAQGRDAAGAVWLDTLGVDLALHAADARLLGQVDALTALSWRSAAGHASHKGRFGDVWVVGGAPGMQGAVQLAARAALQAGAGRVHFSTLADGLPAPSELMARSWPEGRAAGLAEHATVLCGCGGGDAVRSVLPELLSRATRLVLDADALNAIAADRGLAAQAAARGRRGGAATVLTPHPLEAARLLGVATAEVQADRLGAARRLAEHFGAVVVLKGSGSIVAGPAGPIAINPTGNARLATAGTGDVLAGWLGGCWSTAPDVSMTVSWQAAAGSVWLHGRAAEVQPTGLPLVAGELFGAMAALANQLMR